MARPAKKPVVASKKQDKPAEQTPVVDKPAEQTPVVDKPAEPVLEKPAENGHSMEVIYLHS